MDINTAGFESCYYTLSTFTCILPAEVVLVCSSNTSVCWIDSGDEFLQSELKIKALLKASASLKFVRNDPFIWNEVAMLHKNLRGGVW